MKESKFYLKFFKENSVILLAFVILGFLFGWFYSSSKPLIYSKIELLEVGESAGSVNDRINLTDQAVTLSRSENVKSSLGVDPGVQLTIFKPSPFSISVGVSSADQAKLDPNLSKEIGYLMTKFPVIQVGDKVESKSTPKTAQAALVFSSVGLFIGILTSLIKTYFEFF